MPLQWLADLGKDRTVEAKEGQNRQNFVLVRRDPTDAASIAFNESQRNPANAKAKGLRRCCCR